MSLLSEKLRALRGVRSLYDVEKGTGLPRITVRRYEQCENVPSPDNLRKLAVYYQVPYEDLRILYYEDLFARDPVEKGIVLRWAIHYNASESQG